MSDADPREAFEDWPAERVGILVGPEFGTVSRPDLVAAAPEAGDAGFGASDRQSRNSAGKTSFVELVHFLFGADAKPAGIFRSEALRDWTFTATVDMGGESCSISRSGQKPSRIDIAGDLGEWPVASGEGPPLFHGEETSPPTVRRRVLSNEEWKSALGAVWFGLPVDDAGAERFHPTFRSLFSFVARRQEGGGFQDPMQHSTMQQLWERQVAVCYLLGLDWSIPVRFQELRDREKVTKELRKAARTGELGPYIGNAAKLRTRLAVAEDRASRLRGRLDSFHALGCRPRSSTVMAMIIAWQTINAVSQQAAGSSPAASCW